MGLWGHALINPSHNSMPLTETELFVPPPCERNPTPLDTELWIATRCNHSLLVRVHLDDGVVHQYGEL